MGENCCNSEKEGECCEEPSYSDEMMELAHQAWADLMIDKMKAYYEKQKGEKMNNLAKLSVDACSEFWKCKMDDNKEGIKSVMDKFEEDLNKESVE